MCEAGAAKFKVGDRVEVIADQGNLVERGMKFTVTRVNVTNAFWYDGDTNGAGVWEKNLKLVSLDFTAVNVGDRVRLTGNDEVHEFVAVAAMGGGQIHSHSKIAFYQNEGWTVEILESAKPELPTEPGYYSAHDNLVNSDFVVRITEGGEIQFQWGSKFIPLESPERFAPFTRLVPATSND